MNIYLQHDSSCAYVIRIFMNRKQFIKTVDLCRFWRPRFLLIFLLTFRRIIITNSLLKYYRSNNWVRSIKIHNATLQVFKTAKFTYFFNGNFRYIKNGYHNYRRLHNHHHYIYFWLSFSNTVPRICCS